MMGSPGGPLGEARDTPGLHPSRPSLPLSTTPVTPFLLSGESEGVGSEVTLANPLPPVGPGFV